MVDRGATESGRGTLVRTLVLAAAVVATLLLGAAAGVLIKLPHSDDTPVPAADSVDAGFCQDMAMHHLQAVQMANIARERSADPKVRQLAFDIAGTQLEQTGRMKGWLMMWSLPEQPRAGQHMDWMAAEGGHQHNGSDAGSTGASQMPGMATSEELAQLRGLSGLEFDVYFLQLMLRHHQGGAPMAQFAAEHATQHVVRTLAESMLKSQSSESALMKQLLQERGSQPL